MGKFDGVLLVSDYDNTFAIGSDVHPDNLAMLDYFKAQGGRFTIATGRIQHTFRHVFPLIPLNAPVLLSNGASIYDFAAGKLLDEFPLPPTVREDMALLSSLRPDMSLEIYCGEHDIYYWNPNDYVHSHLDYTQAVAHLCPIAEMPLPWNKAILEHDHATLLSLQADIRSRWGDRYEVIFSAENMLELNAKGCSKGAMTLRLADMLGIRRDRIYCVGDNENDLSMLEISAIPFAPENAIPAVREFPGLHLLPRCEDGAIAALIRHLDTLF